MEYNIENMLINPEKIISKDLLDNMSVSDKLAFMWNICRDLCYKPGDGIMKENHKILLENGMSEDGYDAMHSILDGGYHMAYEQQSTGRCSWQSMIDFDIAKFEDSMDKEINYFHPFLVKLVK